MGKRRFAIGATFALVLCVGALLGWVGKAMAMGEAVPGSEADPLVSRSYVEERLSEVLETALGQLDAERELLVVTVPKGCALIGAAGVEIVLRSGAATVVDSELGGLADVTAGVDLRQGQDVPTNHLLIVPRDDGRGVSAVTDLILLVRGHHEIR